MIDLTVMQNVDRIVNEVSAIYGIDPKNIYAKGRWEPLASARKEAMRRCRKELKLSLPVLGEVFHRHHTTILSACR